MGSLSKTEIAFLKGKLQPSEGYRRVLLHRIRKKRQQMLEELKLIERFLETATE